MTAKLQKGERGWALLETIIAIAIFGFLAVATADFAQLSTALTKAVDGDGAVDQAQISLVGYANSHAHFPAPLDGLESPGRPGYLEGWLPAKELGLPSSAARIRYLVHSKLTKVPAIYDPDPSSVGGGAIPKRTTLNVLDFCAVLIGEDMAGTSLPGGMRAGMGVQMDTSRAAVSSESPAGFWAHDSADPPKAATVALKSSVRGFAEVAAQFGCYTRMREIATQVRAVAVSSDVKRLLEHEKTLAQIELDQLNGSIRNFIWRGAARSVSISVYAIRQVLALLILDITPAGVAKGAINLVGWAALTASTADLLQLTFIALESAQARLPSVTAAVAAADAKVMQANEQILRQVKEVNDLVMLDATK